MAVPENFEDRDLSDSVFWGVNLQRAYIRDADLSGSTLFHVFLRDVSIDGEIDRLVVNGVDVTDFVNEHDRWWPLRTCLSPDTIEGVVDSWTTLEAEWAAVLSTVAGADPAVIDASVGGEWSLHDTLRHLLFAADKWFVLPILGESSFTSIGLPNTSSQGGEWPGLDADAQPDFATVLAARAAQHERFASYITSTRTEDLPETVTILENGSVPALMCLHVVLEEEFEHLRYMVRDLAALGVL